MPFTQQLEPLKRVTLPALLQRLEQGDYHVIHFIGHGDFDEQRQIGVLVLEAPSRLGRMVSAEDFNQVLADERSFKLAVLNMCNGARTSAADPSAGVAQSLVRQGIPGVIGMQFKISDAAAKQFAAAFYHALADDAPVDDALTQARKAIFAHGNGVDGARRCSTSARLTVASSMLPLRGCIQTHLAMHSRGYVAFPHGF